MLENFIYAKQKSLFEEALNNGEVLDEAIVFIEDTKEIWNHGTYFDGNAVDLSNIETSIENIINNKQDTIEDLDSIREGAALGATSVQPAAISDMETKTNAAATYQLIGDYATKSEIPTKVSELENDVPYIADYVMPENGVYIVDLVGNLYTTDSWTGGNDATGVAVITDQVSIIVAPDEWYTTTGIDYDWAWNGNKYSAWGGYDRYVIGVVITTDQSTALTDFAGSSNTYMIVSQLEGNDDGNSSLYTGAPAAEYCEAYSKGCKGVGEWYLPAAGEMNVLVTNKDAINTALTKISGETLGSVHRTWTSTQFDLYGAWCYYWSNENFANYFRGYSLGVRPVCAFEVKPLKERVSEIETAFSGVISEAPEDGNQYVRKDGEWVPITPNEICQIELVSNQRDEDAASLIGASVVVTLTGTGTELYNGTWDGNIIMVSVTQGMEYKVSVSGIDGYATPSEQTYTASAFVNRFVSMEYKTTLVRVTLSADDDSSAVGQIITINGEEFTYSGEVLEQKVAFGSECTVSVNDKAGYSTPSNQTFTASEAVKNLSFVYLMTGVTGIFIQDIYGNLYTKDEWDGSQVANGVAVIVPECEFVVTNESYISGDWMSTDTLISGVTTTTTLSEALSDYNGTGNTSVLLDNDSELASNVNGTLSPAGSHGYIPALGELNVYLENKTEITELLTLIN